MRKMLLAIMLGVFSLPVLSEIKSFPISNTEKEILKYVVGSDDVAYKIPVQELVDEYSKNSAQAELKYRGQKVEVSGVISRIRETSDDGLIFFLLPVDNELGSIQTILTNQEREFGLSAKVGDSVKLVCRVKQTIFNVMPELSECESLASARNNLITQKSIYKKLLQMLDGKEDIATLPQPIKSVIIASVLLNESGAKQDCVTPTPQCIDSFIKNIVDKEKRYFEKTGKQLVSSFSPESIERLKLLEIYLQTNFLDEKLGGLNE